MFSVTATTNSTIASNRKRPRGLLGEQIHASSQVKKVRRIIMSSLPDRMVAAEKKKKDGEAMECNPDSTLQNILREGKVSPLRVDYAHLENFFYQPTQADVDNYQHDLLAAVRGNELSTLQRYRTEKGRSLQCSNAFGESILHLACRKSMVQIAEYLLNEAHVPVQVCDDYGRNPLHDAVWVHTPNFDLMDILLEACPDLLYIQDKRGHTPLSFARRDTWKAWNAYLKTKSVDFLKPRKIGVEGSGVTICPDKVVDPNRNIATVKVLTPVAKDMPILGGGTSADANCSPSPRRMTRADTAPVALSPAAASETLAAAIKSAHKNQSLVLLSNMTTTSSDNNHNDRNASAPAPGAATAALAALGL